MIALRQDWMKLASGSPLGRYVFLAFMLGITLSAQDPLPAQDRGQNPDESRSLQNDPTAQQLDALYQLGFPSLTPATPTTVLPSTYYGRKRNLTYDPFRRSPTGRILNDEIEGALPETSRDNPGTSYSRNPSIEINLPERRETNQPTPSLSMTQPGASISLDPMGWNGLMPLAPGTQLLPVPSTKTGGLSPALKAPAPILPSQSDLQSKTLSTTSRRMSPERSDSTRLPQTGSSILKSRGDDPQDPGNLTDQPIRTTKKKKLKKGDNEEKAMEADPSLLLQPISPSTSQAPATRLKSQSLSSSGGMSNLSNGASRITPEFTSPFGGAALQPPQPPSRRFHGGNPGEARRPDYTYQYQGPRRYSHGESEYGRGSTYQSLPYYRRYR